MGPVEGGEGEATKARRRRAKEAKDEGGRIANGMFGESRVPGLASPCRAGCNGGLGTCNIPDSQTDVLLSPSVLR